MLRKLQRKSDFLCINLWPFSPVLCVFLFIWTVCQAYTAQSCVGRKSRAQIASSCIAMYRFSGADWESAPIAVAKMKVQRKVGRFRNTNTINTRRHSISLLPRYTFISHFRVSEESLLLVLWQFEYQHSFLYRKT